MSLNNNISSLDFEDIVNDFKSFLRTKNKFKDFDFAGSNMSMIIYMLAYGIQKYAMIAHLKGNETNLSTAQRRGNVVSYAKSLGYVPRSRKASEAVIDILVSLPIGTNQTLTLPKETRLTTIIDGNEVQFVVAERQTVSRGIDNTFLFENVRIIQGIRKRVLYRFDERNESPRFTIPDDNIDVSTLKVSIKENDSSESETPFFKFTRLWEANEESNIYHLQENYSGKYEVYFGDDVFGRRPRNNNVIILDYIYTDGILANGSRIFSIVGDIGGNSNLTVTTKEIASGGIERDTIERIRYVAPLIRQSYDSAVTEQDYIAIILQNFDDIETITTWGGETNPIPNYGSINISIKPFNRDYLTREEKDKIFTFLKNVNVGSITPKFIDPEYTYIAIDNEFKYVPDNTYRTKTELETIVKDAIIKYNDDNLQTFGGVFRLSRISSNVDNSDRGIISNINKVYCYKFITPFNNKDNFFELQFTNPIYDTKSVAFSLNSSGFPISGITHYFGDKPTDVEGIRQVFVYKIVDGIRVEVINDAGTVDTVNGRVVLTNFRPDVTNDIRITILPNSDDLSPKRNQILRILPNYVTSKGSIDTIVVGGSGYGSTNYTTTPKSRL